VTIVVVNNSGLGNRIKNIVSAVRKGHLIGDVVDIRCDHQDLFSVAQCIAIPRTDHFEVMSTWGLLTLPGESERKLLRVPKSLMVYHDRTESGPLGNRIDFHYFNIEQDVIDEFLRYFSLIIFNRRVVEAVEAYSAEFELDKKVGVHIRTWYDAPDRFSTLYDIKDYFLILDKLADTEGFFLCVDHEIAREAMLARYGSARVFEPKGRTIAHVSIDSRDSVGFDSMVDMLLLSRCKHLVGTYQSTFSECAWWLGGASKTVQVPTPKKIVELEQSAPV